MSSTDVMQKLSSETFTVGKHGFVRIVDWMGYDSSIVQAARVSYGAGTKTVREDKELIRYLMRKGHTSPFEHCEIKLHVRVPMDVWRQWIR
jgi:thymidylate synthase (FAD)